MEKPDFLVLLDEVFELRPGTLKGPEVLDDLGGWDSLAAMSFIAMANEHFNVILSPRQFINCRTINDLLRLVDLVEA